MARNTFERELTELAQEITSMGDAIDSRLLVTIEALRTLDLEKAKLVAQSDDQIDRQEHEIEKMCLKLIALQQPIAGDLRMIAACLKILTDMERVADQCADICDIVAGGDFNGNSLTLSHVVRMMEEARSMFRRAIDVFISRDMEEAKAICEYDDVVDAMFSKIILEVCDIITQNPHNVMCEVDMIFITKYIERTADHATNIAEWVIYMENGEHPDLNPKL
ncbi:phosphate signaling complex protein PhoU [Clostridium minihomine]|uniref:phosphate signaling complex protein PhoU n=1 Tax=Clostridium minihomine TaxID=2045012 RepID=UPI000C7805C4|nr:phosphate signaling complex protein PhoU [Clostridium minihomine]